MRILPNIVSSLEQVVTNIGGVLLAATKVNDRYVVLWTRNNSAREFCVHYAEHQASTVTSTGSAPANVTLYTGFYTTKLKAAYDEYVYRGGNPKNELTDNNL